MSVCNEKGQSVGIYLSFAVVLTATLTAKVTSSSD